MTTSAIIAGLIPTSLGLGIGGQGRAAIAITVIGGQSLCLFLTLLLVPVAYVKFDALEQSIAEPEVEGMDRPRKGRHVWPHETGCGRQGRVGPREKVRSACGHASGRKHAARSGREASASGGSLEPGRGGGAPRHWIVVPARK